MPRQSILCMEFYFACNICTIPRAVELCWYFTVAIFRVFDDPAENILILKRYVCKSIISVTLTRLFFLKKGLHKYEILKVMDYLKQRHVPKVGKCEL